MDKQNCCTCFKPKATLVCGICNEAVCKSCAQFLNDEDFAFLTDRPQELTKDTFCNPCFSAKVEPALENYRATLARAREIDVFYKVQNKETRFIKRDEERIQIENCEDRDEVILRLAFQAAARDFNGLIDVEVDSRKVRRDSYQTTEWFGSGLPAHIDPNKLMKDRSFKSQPN